ncbi:carboxylesterase family protein [Microbacterium sp. Se5.02b]|uniref:carboxylesterase family protein n=1 Tax=Microbacterium sp. Se5.02b TaxID=2864103 RepID=UPI00215D77BE|nr:carboxylesterase family protein [Microbacterium sp. Se5.02b]
MRLPLSARTGSRAPQPTTAWHGVREATRFGPTPPQHPYAGEIGELLGSVRIDGDDILTANVWAPTEASGAPVLLWIHGGALERGTAALPLYDGTVFANAGVVFVSINYRLGSEGFSVLDGAPRNLGLRDAAAALEWVHREIAAFGGDPARITAMGESAGGAVVAGLRT